MGSVRGGGGRGGVGILRRLGGSEGVSLMCGREDGGVVEVGEGMCVGYGLSCGIDMGVAS